MSLLLRVTGRPFGQKSIPPSSAFHIALKISVIAPWLIGLFHFSRQVSRSLLREDRRTNDKF